MASRTRSFPRKAKEILETPPETNEVLSHFSGLETVTVSEDSNFQLIGERTNVSGSALFRRLIKSSDYEAALSVALDQVR